MRRVIEVVLVVVLVAVSVAILWPVYSGGGPPKGCLSHVKQLGLALHIYEADHGALPFRDHWTEAAATMPRALLRCPVVEREKLPGFGYAFNSTLAKKPLPTKNPETVPMVYDSINYGPNASDPFISLPVPGRHNGRNMIVYADGHSRSVAMPKP